MLPRLKRLDPLPAVLPTGFAGVELGAAGAKRFGVEDVDVVAGFGAKNEDEEG